VAELPGRNLVGSVLGADPVDTFLKEHVRAHPGLRLAAIVQACQRNFGVTRRTVARHLARLVRFGELTLLPEHTYVITEPAASTSRAVIELRWFDAAFIINPDGTARVFHNEEFRVVSGQLDHLEFNHPKPPRQFIWWCTSPGRATRIPARRSLSQVVSYHLQFVAPLTARDSAWQWLSVNRIFSRGYSMAYTSRSARPADGGDADGAVESESVQIQSQGRRFGQRVSPDAHLRLQVMLPEGYPVGPVRSRVRFVTEPTRIDTSEETRLTKLRGDESSQDGFRRSGTAMVLSVPHPLLDRHYMIEWGLPTVAQQKRWLLAQRRAKAK
jgi:hypothetical protein